MVNFLEQSLDKILERKARLGNGSIDLQQLTPYLIEDNYNVCLAVAKREDAANSLLLQRYRQELAKLLIQDTYWIDDFIRNQLLKIFLFAFQDNELTHACIYRSMIEFLITATQETILKDYVDLIDVSEVDEELLKACEAEGSGTPEQWIPHGIPVEHWWWRYPDISRPNPSSYTPPFTIAQNPEHLNRAQLYLSWMILSSEGHTVHYDRHPKIMARFLFANLEIERIRVQYPGWSTREQLEAYQQHACAQLRKVPFPRENVTAFVEEMQHFFKPELTQENWRQICYRRSAVEFLEVMTKAHQPRMSYCDFDVLMALDNSIMDIDETVGYQEGDIIPEGIPAEHWWWWYPQSIPYNPYRKEIQY